MTDGDTSRACPRLRAWMGVCQGAERTSSVGSNGYVSKEGPVLDKLNPAQRSKMMASVAQRNTAPELAVRKLLSILGFRYRLHRAGLPGRPDIVFPGRMKIIFVHGCFWHHHSACPRGRMPDSRQEFWVPKLLGNAKRDRRNERRLRKDGWGVMTIWQCQLLDQARLRVRLLRFLGPVRCLTE